MSVTATRLKELRTQKKLTQSELAETIKSSRGTIAKYERDERVPSFAVLSIIADALDTTVDYLQGKTDNAFKTVHSGSAIREGKKHVDLDDDELVMSFEGKELSEDYKKSILAFVKMLREDRK
ncbi:MULTISPECIES: helix-turn-helix domain-containing protein [Leuconostoc]|uniref:helix-turn-helix domain-containing protein n=1 Tax=Leuconostoc TaxID=1243 RepID=UPI000EC86817|nr:MULTISPECIES: helix-turn-helix transcriptional regulator [Leuconostoc]MCJ2166999.1 helix-turn-helix transcriptional regulator [Leuconostoc citreum]MCT3055366.1 XRE family transcriptional regulator [Leuconostoc citreum]MCT3056853.1 XRE family transcriptional regulator [Leuconostoc citreum]MCT3060214.1 XRE family transcriptional regulator [Leuconostoc citreum]MCT3063139.1 XRE family transcriptional regulator [Leuconostoc citreum]